LSIAILPIVKRMGHKVRFQSQTVVFSKRPFQSQTAALIAALPFVQRILAGPTGETKHILSASSGLPAMVMPMFPNP
jgi:hypothetical protein